MKKMTLLAAVLGMAFIVGAPAKSEAFCLIFCGGDESAEVDVHGSNVTDSSVSAGDGNTTAIKNSNSVVVGDDAIANQSNTMGGIGINRGDLSHSNSANLTDQQNTDIRDNDMRSFRGVAGNNN